MGDCRYPDCKAAALQTWALVPLCAEHRELIREETERYYNQQKMPYHDRKHFMQIMPLIPWSRKE
ncbi:hypothetical protein [Paenibacillus sp. P46E]|uniref:hypothetical protein n=1 Tax=Paenibacillus sp. P46E TaxID=1349436 RepID=UPI00093D3E9C|nr:hypothetical protein [Paenibacillus sp. P46E]OKP97741.1 hypothetical protein A3849_13625 [Paenibacillus sp. P46E]